MKTLTAALILAASLAYLVCDVRQELRRLWLECDLGKE
jgi:hypothetical protein